ncbi:MAG: hypothetical protein KGI54_16480 [Pseudomonadota bacterium]|nr:hypothetical protein [Pseudomonadota bacterium]
MSDKPMTPREDVEEFAKVCDDVYENDIMCVDKCPSFNDLAAMLRALLSERDSAYKRGQEDMREAAMRIVGDLPAEEGGEVFKAFSEIAYLPIKETPDA